MNQMRLLRAIFVGALTLSPAIAEEEAKKDRMTAEYRSPDPFPTHGITMAGALNAIGITRENIDYLKLVGDESSMTSDLTKKVKIDEFFWDRYFETAEPYKYWLSSGYRRLEVYVKGEPKPKTTIYINETDSCYVEGDPRKLRYMCRGLEQWFMATLDPEPKKAQRNTGTRALADE